MSEHDSILWNVLYHESVDAIFIVDPALSILQANHKASVLFGFTPGSTLDSFFSTESCLNLSNLIQSGFIGRCLVQLIDHDSKSYSLMATLVSEKVVLQFIEFESKHPIRSQQNLLSLGRFLGEVVHAMSNPLAVLQGRIELLLHKSSEYPKTLQRHFSSMFEQCSRIADQLQLIQILSRRKTLQVQPISIKQELLRFLEGYRGDADLEVKFDTDAHILLEASQFHIFLDQILHICTEKQHYPLSVQFFLDTTSVDCSLHLFFRGLPKDFPLLTIKQQQNWSLIKGMDIRLQLCFLMMEHQGGSFTFKHRKKDFIISLRLPLFLQQGTRSLASALRILIIDDHSNLRETMTALLSKEGHLLSSISTAEEALELLSTASFDVVIADIRLPGMSGLELYDVLLHSHPQVAEKMILISGIQYNIEQPNVPFLRKPFSKQELMLMIQKIV